MWPTITNLIQITSASHSFPLTVFWKDILGFYDRLVGNNMAPLILSSGLRSWTFLIKTAEGQRYISLIH